MTKKFLTSLTIAFLLLTAIVMPFTGNAEQPTIREQGIAMFERNLYFGMRNNAEVRDLQELMTDQGYYTGPITGNFYILTLQGVRKFQAAQGITTTGFFGPLSRAAANNITLTITANSNLEATVGKHFAATFTVTGGEGTYRITGSGEIPGLNFTGTYCAPGMMCAQMISPNTITLTGTPEKAGKYAVTVVAAEKAGTINCITTPCPQPESRYGKQTFTVYVNNGTVSTTDPVISGVSGPTSLAVSAEGTWTIKASNPNGGSLSYRVDWGDAVTGSSASGATKPMQENFVQTTTFSHRYAKAGVYAPIFYVTNEQGATTKSSITVKVGVSDAAPYVRVLAPNTTETLSAGSTYTIKWVTGVPSINNYGTRVMRISLLQQVQCIQAPCNDIETIIADGIDPNQGGWAWTIPTDLVGGTYKVKATLMTAADPCAMPPSCVLGEPCITMCYPMPEGVLGSDTSDQYFKIIAGTVSSDITISSIYPGSAPVNAMITIYGKGFTSTGNTVFMNGGSVMAYNVASNGTSISFPVPEWTGGECLYSQPACKMMAMQVQPGTYKITVKNAYGAVSNSVAFTVTTGMVQ